MALQAPFLGYDLTLVKGDKLSRLFATVFAIMAFAGGLFALNQPRCSNWPPPSAMPAAPSASSSPATSSRVFIFWELMAIGSTLVVWSAGPSARGAGLRYAAIHLLGGVLLMAGIAGEIAATGSLAFGKMDARHACRAG